MAIIDTIRRVIKDYLDYTVLSNGIVGTVVSVNPVRIKIDANITLTEEFLQVDYPIPPGAVGQQISLLRAVGGQKYYVMEKQFWR